MMMIEVLKSKLHCVTVTEANLNYMGSITIDEDLMEASHLVQAGDRDLFVAGGQVSFHGGLLCRLVFNRLNHFFSKIVAETV